MKVPPQPPPTPQQAQQRNLGRVANAANAGFVAGLGLEGPPHFGVARDPSRFNRVTPPKPKSPGVWDTLVEHVRGFTGVDRSAMNADKQRQRQSQMRDQLGLSLPKRR